MYGRACWNLSLWRKYKTNIDTLLLIFAFFNEEGSSDIQYQSRSRTLEAKERMMQDKINNQVNRASRLYSGSNVSNDYQFGDN